MKFTRVLGSIMSSGLVVLIYTLTIYMANGVHYWFTGLVGVAILSFVTWYYMEELKFEKEFLFASILPISIVVSSFFLDRKVYGEYSSIITFLPLLLFIGVGATICYIKNKDFKLFAKFILAAAMYIIGAFIAFAVVLVGFNGLL